MKKFLAVLLSVALVLSLIGCSNSSSTTDTSTDTTASTDTSSVFDDVEVGTVTEAPTVTTDDTASSDTAAAEAVYVRGDDEEKYEAALGDYETLLNAAESTNDVDERFLLFAQAEAALLASFTMIPNTTQNGAYTISRVAPRTVPYVQWGNDDDRLHSLVATNDDFLTPAEREECLTAWAAAVAGEGEYDPIAILTANGHTIKTDYTTTFSTAPVTIDWLNTSSQSDTEITVNCVDGLVEYNNLGQMTSKLAESWEVSEDGTVYTFHIRQGAYWYTSEGTAYAEVTAEDFVSGFHHMLDTQAGLEWLIDGVIVGGTDYYANGGSWDAVGYKAVDTYTLQITLEKPISYFMTMLTYSCFLPICTSFYQAHGGVFGVSEYATASADTNTYTFGKAEDVASQVYCGPFLLQKLQGDSEILVVRNANYYDNDKTTLDSIKWVYDAGENPDASYNDTLNGVYAGITLGQSTGLLDKAKADGNFDKYAYISDTTSTTYFGGLNLNRGTFELEGGAVASPKTEQEKIDTDTALNNLNFRKAMMYAFDKATVNATSRGTDLACTNLRNMYTHPEFVQLSNDITDSEGKTFTAGTFYGEMVQYYCDKLDLGINVSDGVDGWYNPERAKAALAAAVEELGDSVTWPIQIDVVYYSPSDSLTAQAQAYKSVIESTLGSEYVQVNLLEATTAADYYACGYRASNGEAGNFDMFYGSGWGPDYGDPSTYLDTFKSEGAGYMTKVIGLF